MKNERASGQKWRVGCEYTFGGGGDRLAVHRVAVAVARHDHELIGGARLKLVDSDTQSVVRHDLHRLPDVQRPAATRVLNRQVPAHSRRHAQTQQPTNLAHSVLLLTMTVSV